MRFVIKRVTGLSVSTLFLLSSVNGSCPYFSKNGQPGLKVPANHHHYRRQLKRDGDGGIPDGGYSAVKQYIKDNILTNSQDFRPADFDPPHYGGLMVRLAWHCSGSYRAADGRGGCDGGRIRFSPEADWADNGGLKEARKLLEPVKEYFGSKLSWGDLIILAGDAAIEAMGGPVLGFCGGRIDDPDGADSLILGPSEAQELLSPCRSIDSDGMCNRVALSPMGPTTVELIYVDPNGFIGNVGDAEVSAGDVRHTFARMGFNDTETVALIGGGHAFGKCHNFTSGFEGPWTSTPTTWSNEYFHNLFEYNWTLGPVPYSSNHEKKQWSAQEDTNVIMLTTDIALKYGVFEPISRGYQHDLDLLSKDFSHVWYKLTTSDMGPHSRCIGDLVPPAQAFQNPLPEASSENVDYIPVRTAIQKLLDVDESNTAAFVNLAYQCASTFRSTDYLGGCNGARIRFAPESEWEENKGSSAIIAKLTPIKDAYPEVSMSDIIVLAGQSAAEHGGIPSMAFCGGRVDVSDGAGSEFLAPRKYNITTVMVKDDMVVKGLTPEEYVALSGRSRLSSSYYADLLVGKDGFSAEERVLATDAEFKPIAEKFASDEEAFKKAFAKAFTKMVIADRFDGPRDNLCEGRDDPTMADAEESPEKSLTSGSGIPSVVVGFTCLAMGVTFFF